jgi:hypothetical protein
MPLSLDNLSTARNLHFKPGLCGMQTGLDNGTAQNSDIENSPPEIHGAKYRPRPRAKVKSAAETALGSANRRKSHGFLNPVYFHNRDWTAWLGREDSNLRMVESKSAASRLATPPQPPIPKGRNQFGMLTLRFGCATSVAD